MKEISLLVVPEHAAKSKEFLLTLFDSEIEDFSNYMSTIGDWKSVGPLSIQERALIKSYLVHKFTGKLDAGK